LFGVWLGLGDVEKITGKLGVDVGVLLDADAVGDVGVDDGGAVVGACVVGDGLIDGC
jgi:hypothetical protein